MASTNKTDFLHLNQWDGADKPKRSDFNTDNKAIDTFAKEMHDLAASKASPSITIPATLLGGNAWIDGQQTISNEAIKAASPGTLNLAQSATDAQYNAYAACKPHVSAQAAGSITIKAFGTVPTIDIPVYVEVRS